MKKKNSIQFSFLQQKTLSEFCLISTYTNVLLKFCLLPNVLLTVRFLSVSNIVNSSICLLLCRMNSLHYLSLIWLWQLCKLYLFYDISSCWSFCMYVWNNLISNKPEVRLRLRVRSNAVVVIPVIIVLLNKHSEVNKLKLNTPHVLFSVR